MAVNAVHGLGYLLDTPVYLEPLQPDPNRRVMENWRAVGESRMGVSALVVCDALAQIQARGSKRIWAAYHGLLEGRFPQVPVDASVVEAFMAILAKPGGGEGVGRRRLDLLHAATARAHGLIMATTRPAVYEAIPGLGVEDWSQPGAA